MRKGRRGYTVKKLRFVAEKTQEEKGNEPTRIRSRDAQQFGSGGRC